MGEILWSAFGSLRREPVTAAVFAEQLTYLLFLCRADALGDLPDDYAWRHLRKTSDARVAEHYAAMLAGLAGTAAARGVIPADAAAGLAIPSNLRKLIEAVEKADWRTADDEERAAAYGVVLERAAAEGVKGLGAAYTPSILIASICRVLQPDACESDGFRIHDPLAKTGRFLIGAYRWMLDRLNGAADPALARRLAHDTYSAAEMQPRLRSLCCMNLLLHGIEPVVSAADALHTPPGEERYNCILTHLPFGTRGSIALPRNRPDIPVPTVNRQLNLLQHVVSLLRTEGRAAVVLSDTCLLDYRSGRVFRALMDTCNLHTLLRLPRGVFMPYAQGVMSNVLFLQNGRPTERLWVYDARSNVPRITRRNRPLSAGHLADFEASYGADPNGGAPRRDTGPQGRFRSFDRSQLEQLGYRIDIGWIEDIAYNSDTHLPDPQDLALEASVQLEAAVDDLRELIRMIEMARPRETDGEAPSALSLF